MVTGCAYGEALRGSEANRKKRRRRPKVLHCQQILIPVIPTMAAPSLWSLAWREDGELAPQDRFDLLQTLVVSESSEVQPALVAAVERLTLVEMSVLSSADVTGLCA
jgi:hypothetical protein